MWLKSWKCIPCAADKQQRMRDILQRFSMTPVRPQELLAKNTGTLSLLQPWQSLYCFGAESQARSVRIDLSTTKTTTKKARVEAFSNVRLSISMAGLFSFFFHDKRFRTVYRVLDWESEAIAYICFSYYLPGMLRGLKERYFFLLQLLLLLLLLLVACIIVGFTFSFLLIDDWF